MKIAVIGATGKAGQKIVAEALLNKLDVTAIVRDASKLNVEIPAIEKEVLSLTSEDLNQFDVVINAFGAPFGHEELHVIVGKHLIKILNGSSTRLIVVGGAGSLFVDEAKTMKVVDIPDFPAEFVPTASNQAANLEDLKASSINWTFVSPSAFFDAEGARTGEFILGEDHLLVNANGDSYISYADFAIALINEAMNGQFIQKRFTVGSK